MNPPRASCFLLDSPATRPRKPSPSPATRPASIAPCWAIASKPWAGANSIPRPASFHRGLAFPAAPAGRLADSARADQVGVAAREGRAAAAVPAARVDLAVADAAT